MTFLLLFLFWLILNGRVTPEVVLVGAALSAALSFAARALLGSPPRPGRRLLRCLPGAFAYLLYLVGQVLLSDFQVIRLILSPKGGEGRPRLIWFTPDLEGDAARLVLANSITLTPGTVTVWLGERTLCVYALRPAFGEGLRECGFLKKLRKLEGESDG